VIVPFATVSWTCTGPQRVEATLPVTVDDALPVPEPMEPVAPLVVPDVPVDDDVESPGAVVAPAVPPADVVPLPVTGATAEDFGPAEAAVEDVEVW
jgi:hypothetical protein